VIEDVVAEFNVQHRVDNVVGFDVILLLPAQYPLVEDLPVLVTGSHKKQPKVAKLLIFKVIRMGGLGRR
jgi:hypothetical protein